MDTRSKIGILLIVYSLQLVVSAPPSPTVAISTSSSPSEDVDPAHRLRRVRRADDRETGRIFWSAVGDILESLPFLPFTVNVPDVVSGVWNFFTGFLPGSTNKKPKNSTVETTEVPITRQDVIDYFFYDS